MISCIKSCDFCNKRHHCIYPFTWKKKYMYTIEPYVYMYTWSCFELWMWNKNAVLPKPWIKQTYIYIYIICTYQKNITPALKTAEYPFSETYMIVTEDFWKFIQCTAPYSWVQTRISQKGLFEWAVCLTNNNSRKNRWKKRMNFCLHPKSWLKLRDWHGLQLVNGGWDVKTIDPMLQQPKNK